MRLCFLSVTVLALAGCDQIGKKSPDPYECGDVGSRAHCYSLATLGDHTTGMRTTISIPTTLQGGNGFLNNEFWLSNYSGNEGWIELGYQANQYQLPKYFWAQLDPDTGVYTDHDIADIPESEFGSEVTFDVHQTGENAFQVSVDGPTTKFSTTTSLHLWNGAYGGSVKLGMEIAGTSGAVATLATFKHNTVYSDQFRPHEATEDDLPTEASQDEPPCAGWLEMPSALTPGGVFSTHCCTP